MNTIRIPYSEMKSVIKRILLKYGIVEEHA